MVRPAGISFNILFIHVNGSVNCFSTETAVPAANAAEAALEYPRYPRPKEMFGILLGHLYTI